MQLNGVLKLDDIKSIINRCNSILENALISKIYSYSNSQIQYMT